MAWLILFLAGILEVIWAFAMKLSQGFTRPVPAFITITAMIASFWLLALAMRSLPLGTAYSVWTGIGAAGGALVGMIFFKESKDWRRVVFITLILAAAIGLKLFS